MYNALKYRSAIILILSFIILLTAWCGSDSKTSTHNTIENIDFNKLQSWNRHDDPVLRDPELGIAFEVAADPHVFRTRNGALQMVYSGPHPSNDYATIKLASATSHFDWAPGAVLLEGSNSGGLDLNKETSFYRLAKSGKHQIYYIGYEDSEYKAQIFMAEADTLEGPYSLPTAPIIPLMVQHGLNVKVMTSPSIVEHEDRLYMAYCAWDDFPVPTIVKVHGATSDDDGKSWDLVGEVPVPSCMEGAFTSGPDGYFYAVSQDEGNMFTIGRSEKPFGTYDMLPQPVMTSAGAPWEIDEMNTPQLFFENDKAYLYYSGADYSKGWWTMLATTDLINSAANN